MQPFLFFLRDAEGVVPYGCAEIHLYRRAGEQNMTARVSSRSQARAGDKIKVAIEAERIHIFDKDTQKCLVH